MTTLLVVSNATQVFQDVSRCNRIIYLIRDSYYYNYAIFCTVTQKKLMHAWNASSELVRSTKRGELRKLALAWTRDILQSSHTAHREC